MEEDRLVSKEKLENKTANHTPENTAAESTIEVQPDAKFLSNFRASLTTKPPEPKTPDIDDTQRTVLPLADKASLIPGTTIETTPEDYFGDFHKYLESTVNSFETSATETHKKLTTELSLQVSSLQEDVLFALTTVESTLKSELMEVNYVRSPPNLAMIELLNRCEYVHVNAFKKYKLFLSNLYALAVDKIVVFKCGEADFHGRLQKFVKTNTYFIVIACLFHHYEVENLKCVSILSRARLIVESDERDRLMFVYLIKAGFF